MIHVIRRIALGCTPLVLYILAACLPIPAAAGSEPELTYPTGTLLATASAIKATNVGAPQFTSTEGNIGCSSAAMTGKLNKNSGGSIEATIESVSFNSGGTCTGAHALSINTSPSENGLPWCLRSTPELKADEFQIRGNSCDKAVRPIRFQVSKYAVTRQCVYEQSEPLTGTYSTGEGAVLTNVNTEFKRISGLLSCPEVLVVHSSYTLETVEGTPISVFPGPSLALSTGTEVRASSTSSVQLTGIAGATLTCSSSELTGTLVKNSGSEIEVDIEGASISGESTLNTCSWPMLIGNPEFTFGGATNGLPWCFRATSKMAADEFQIRGNSCASESRPIRFSYDLYGTTGCVYERKAALTGSYATHPNDAALNFEEAIFLEVGSSKICPDQTQLDSSMTLESDGEGKALYIS
jgi:hypothetical protein